MDLWIFLAPFIALVVVLGASWLATRSRTWFPQDPRHFRTETEKRLEYQREGSHEVRIELAEDRSAKVARAARLASVSLTIRLSDDEVKTINQGQIKKPLVECWTRLSASGGHTGLQQYSIVLQDLDKPDFVTYATEDNVVRFFVQPGGGEAVPQGVTIKFKTPSLVSTLSGGRRPVRPATRRITRFLDGRPPFGLQVIHFGLKPRTEIKKTIISCDYPHSVAPRWRNVKAEYRTITSAVDKEKQRQSAFVDQKETEFRYTFGTDDDFELSAPAFPIVRIGVSFFALAIGTTLYDKSGLLESRPALVGAAQVLLAVVVATSFLDAFRRRRLFFPSLIEGRASLEAVTLGFSGTLFLIVLLLFLRQLDQGGCLLVCVDTRILSVLAGICGLFAGTYFYLLQTGRLQNFTCDYCGRGTPVGRFAGSGVDRSTGQFLCKDHFNQPPGPRYVTLPNRA